MQPSHPIRSLSSDSDLETVPVLKALNQASRALATLKGQARSIPNQGILIGTLALQDAKVSSEIKNIVTTQDELFQTNLFPDGPQSAAAKGDVVAQGEAVGQLASRRGLGRVATP